MSGSSKLTPDQQEFFVEKFGERYTTVQEQPIRPSRRIRRAKAGKRTARISESDVQAFNVQRALLARLTGRKER